jgi:uncharacterized protein YdaU (DUF1376 family)
MKIKYVQLESDAFLTDIDFVQFTPAERGVYCSLILYLTSNGGKCTSEPEALSRICNCEDVEQFEKIWQMVSKKFQHRKGFIRHKRVTKELKKARHFRQACTEAGLKGASKRWSGHGNPDGVAIAKERKRNEKVSKDISNTNTSEQALSSSSSLQSDLQAGCSPGVENQSPRTSEFQIRGLHFNDALERIITPASRSDRTCFRNVTTWLVEGCARGRFNHLIFDRVLDYARHARRGDNPAACFMAVLKKELRYRPKGEVE